MVLNEHQNGLIIVNSSWFIDITGPPHDSGYILKSGRESVGCSYTIQDWIVCWKLFQLCLTHRGIDLSLSDYNPVEGWQMLRSC